MTKGKEGIKINFTSKNLSFRKIVLNISRSKKTIPRLTRENSLDKYVTSVDK